MEYLGPGRMEVLKNDGDMLKGANCALPSEAPAPPGRPRLRSGEAGPARQPSPEFRVPTPPRPREPLTPRSPGRGDALQPPPPPTPRAKSSSARGKRRRALCESEGVQRLNHSAILVQANGLHFTLPTSRIPPSSNPPGSVSEETLPLFSRFSHPELERPPRQGLGFPPPPQLTVAPGPARQGRQLHPSSARWRRGRSAGSSEQDSGPASGAFGFEEIRLVLSLPLPGRPLHSPRHPTTSKLPQSHGSGAWEPRTVRQPRPCSGGAGGTLCPRTSISLETAQTHLCGTSPTGSSPARSHCEKRIVLLPPGIPVSPPRTLP
ncbi:splicing factor, proline- and glutamine-rich-like [Felis catus]|uniref:splicing factor, proline- and glutamine-rich-like n=1 Tax=Felis catus TaxID=9685 RepID=UPI001D198D4A|nr:splicing factor, proline- and glutamine-rich-like [Felis catus]